MIYLIDDTPLTMLEGYFSLSNYSDVIKRIEDLQGQDIQLLSGADCILIHASYHNQTIKKEVLSLSDYGEKIPLVQFSDGDRQEAEFDGENYITAIKKSVLYSRLERFIKEYQCYGRVKFSILSGEKIKQKEPLKENAFSDFFKSFSLEFNTDKQMTEKPSIFCIGREGMNSIARNHNGIYIKLSINDLINEDNKITEKDIHDFIIRSFQEEIQTLILDLDADPEIYLDIALHIRLTTDLPGRSHLCSIVFISDLDLERLIKKGFYSQILLTENIYICSRKNLTEHLNHSPLEESSYRSDFLDRINIPAPKGSNHSIANQWGASRLYAIVNEGRSQIDFTEFNDVNKELYYKFMLQKIAISDNTKQIQKPFSVIKGAVGKKILLIDDQAEKGWGKTIDAIFPSSRLDIISESILCYDDFSEEAKDKIQNNVYDLYLLDLRLGGIREDAIVETEKMSGYDVLHQIKKINKGNQVIILTASNKVWNHRALIQSDAGANGYFVKESPEYEFPDELSLANLVSLKSDAETCFERGYLRDFWCFKESIKEDEDSVLKEIYTQLSIAYDMAANADSKDKYNYAFLSLFQVLEIINSSYTEEAIVDSEKYLNIINDEGKLILCNEIINDKVKGIILRLNSHGVHQTNSERKSFSQKDKFSAVYLKKWGQEDKGILYLIGQLITIRNAIIHVDASKRFDCVSLIKENDINSSKYLGANDLIYNDSRLKILFKECSQKELLYIDSKGLFNIHKAIVNYNLGIKLLLWCYEYIIPLIKSTND